MQHFISDSKRDARGVMDKSALENSNVLPRQKLTGLIIDETGTVKKRGQEYWGSSSTLNIIVSYFFLKEKLLCSDDLPLLSANDIREWICFKLFQSGTDDEYVEKFYDYPQLTP